ENLIREGFINASLDVTTTELADEIVGGTLSAGPTRLTAARDKKIPQVVSVGALDMVNFGPKETVPEKFKNRNLYVHNENVTLMRTTAEECEKIALDICHKLNESTTKVALLLPLLGVSAISTKGQVFYDQKADEALFSTIRKHLKSNVELVELNCAISDQEFSDALAFKLLSLLK
ncbi:MAG: Tm-1-like ATP-binding domain-containing protein, partial [Actinomycetes bacterium]